MSTNIYVNFVFPDKLVSPVNEYTCRQLSSQNIRQFGFETIRSLHEQFPGFPLRCETRVQNQNASSICAGEKLKQRAAMLRDEKKQDYERSIKPQCCQCENDLPYEKRDSRFCNRSCSASYTNMRRLPRTEESRLKTSMSVKKTQSNQRHIEMKEVRRMATKIRDTKPCVICGTDVVSRKTCSHECYIKYLSIRQSEYLKVPENRKKYRGNSGRSYLEKSFDAWLTEHYVGKYHEQVHFYNEESSKHGWADFVFPKEKLIIELDGTHHRNRKELDDTRDAYLTRNRGYTVLRVTIHEYYKKTKLELIKSLLNIA